jgi:hypothetical protein
MRTYRFALFGAAMAVGLAVSNAMGQDWGPLPGPYDDSPAVRIPATPFYGATTTSGLVTVITPPATSYYPAATYVQPMTVCRPAPQPYAPAYAAFPTATYVPPVTTYRPVVTVNYVQPTVAYSPVAATAYTPVAYTPAAGVTTVATGPRVWVKPKVYVEGQPIRNLLKAITP